MACNLSDGIGSNACLDNSGGLYTLYLADALTGVTTIADFTTIDATSEIITDFTGTTKAVAGWWEFKPNKTSGAVDETFNIDLAQGTNTVEQKISGSFAKVDADKRKVIKTLLAGAFYLIVKDRNGTFTAYGLNDTIRVSGGGLKIAEGSNGYELEFSASEGTTAYICDSSSITILG